MQVLLGHGWPGNIRQLRNLIERLVVTVDGEVVHENELPAEIHTESRQAVRSLQAAVEEAEKKAILDALTECNNHRENTAKLLDISIRTLHYKMNRYGLH
jgi:two-component system NtrC family response regulator